MSLIETLPHKLDSNASWVEKGGVLWLDPSPISVRELCAEMNVAKARFITITTYQLPGAEGMRLEYHWDFEGQLLGFSFKLESNAPEGNSIESIYDICEAADWIEREIHEEYAIEFTGREYEPLLLRAGDTPGVNLREEVKK
jgi:NADH:ubiquinone oxidoreductase subunit C